MQNFFAQVKGKLIVSCQALADEPLHSPFIMGRMALAAKEGGAAAIRAQGVEDIKEIARVTGLPIIGLIKRNYADSDIYITATQQEVAELLTSPCELIAIDMTQRQRPHGERVVDLIAQVHAAGKMVLADISTYDEGVTAARLGADAVSTTMSGYTPYSPQLAGPDLALAAHLAADLEIPVFAEGRIHTPLELKQVTELGVWSAIVGSAITRPQLITKEFTSIMTSFSSAQPLTGNIEHETDSLMVQKLSQDKGIPVSSITYAGRQLPVLYEAELAVVGAGVSGLAAAITASQRGTKTVLIEKGIALGGLQTLGDVIPCMQTLAPESDTPLVKEVKKRLLANGIDYDDKVTQQVWTNPEVMARVYDAMCAEAGVEVLYNTVLVDVLQQEERIQYMVVQTIAGLQAIRAKTFVDATGDAFLARQAGVPTEHGYEKTGYNQPLSFRFEMGGIDLPKLEAYIAQELQDNWCKSRLPHFEIAEARHRAQRYVLEKFMLEGVKSGELTEAEAEYMQAFTVVGKPGVMAFNCPELPLQFSATEPLSYSKGIAYGRQMQYHLSQYFIKHLPGFEHAYIAKEASLLGARESWRIRGQYYLMEQAYYEQSHFADAVARTAWFIDAHGEKVSEKLPEGGYYEIPYRALITREISNLLVVGRCLSASFIMQASLRIQLTCMSIGEAAGVAANYALQQGIAVNKLCWENIPLEQRSYVSR